MKDVIYYFSGTGNSLDIAKQLSEELDMEVRHIALEQDTAVIKTMKRVGFVFPVYGYGPPGMMEEFLSRCPFQSDQYIFAVAASGGNAGGTMTQVRKRIKRSGGTLSAGFVTTHVSMRKARSGPPTGFIGFMKKISGPSHDPFPERREAIVSLLKEQSVHGIEKSRTWGSMVGNFIHGIAVMGFKAQGKKFYITEDCTSCDQCIKMCPTSNIIRKEGQLVWGSNCQQCNSCLVLCPHNGIATNGADYSNLCLNSSINRKEMILR